MKLIVLWRRGEVPLELVAPRQTCLRCTWQPQRVLTSSQHRAAQARAGMHCCVSCGLCNKPSMLLHQASRCVVLFIAKAFPQYSLTRSLTTLYTGAGGNVGSGAGGQPHHG